ncbi:NlpC/P60 family protein [Streptomyces thermogriseus]|uniref:C40 family peptidase n=1 Tax=Streptomyces thermogriseus TaxID=75292 RepID=UPI003621C7F6
MAPERPSDGKPSPAEVQQRINSLYDQAENATGNFNATRAMSKKRRAQGGSQASDPAVDQLAKRWFDVARAQLGPIVPAALPPDRMPSRGDSRPGTSGRRPADALKGRSLEGGSSRLELTASPAQAGPAPALPATASAAPAGELPMAAPVTPPAAPLAELTSRSMEPQPTGALDALPAPGTPDPRSTGSMEALTSRSMQPPPAGATDALTTGATEVLPTVAADPQSTGSMQALTSRSMQPPPAGATDALTTGATEVLPTVAADPRSTGSMQALTSRSMQPSPAGATDALTPTGTEPTTGIVEVLPPRAAEPQPTGSMDALSAGAPGPQSTGSMNVLPTGPVAPPPAGAADALSTGTANPQSTGSMEALTSRSMQPPSTGSMDALSAGAADPRSTGSMQALTSRSMQPPPAGATDALTTGTANPQSTGSMNVLPTGPVAPPPAGPTGPVPAVGAAVPPAPAAGAAMTPTPATGAQPQAPGAPRASVAGRRQPVQRAAKGQWQTKVTQARELLSQQVAQQEAAQWQQRSTGMFDTTPPLDGNSLFDASQAAGQGTAGDTGAGSPGAAEASASSSYERKGAKALEFARAQIGKPCVWGATGPDSYDCSSLIQAAWRTAGVELPRTAAEQAGFGTPIELADLRPGDLIFFYKEVNHVGLYAGDSKMVHAPSPGASIREESIFFAGPQAIHSAVRPA